MSLPTEPPTLPQLSPELWMYICSHLQKPSRLRMRLVSRMFNTYALPFAFRSLRLEAYGTSPERLVQIAKCPKLRHLVSELTIDTWVGPDFEYNSNKTFDIPSGFMDALPYICWFGNVTAIHLRFSEFCGDPDRSMLSNLVEETWKFRYRVLDTICHCIAGMWTKERQLAIDATANLPGYEPNYPQDDTVASKDRPLPVTELTIMNLADYEDEDLKASEAWQRVLALPTLVDLKILITTETHEPAPEDEVYIPEKYDMIPNLPRTWLRSDMTEHLAVLSLFYRQRWGWFPKLDFRLIGGQSPFPRLRVLALGNYVLSHEWQMDWMASLGKGNGRGGLEELYLDECVILHKAEVRRGAFELGSDYPNSQIVARRRGTGRGRMSGDVREFPIRWHTVLSRWAQSMQALKVFGMDQGNWSLDSQSIIDAALAEDVYDPMDYQVAEARFTQGIHREFACLNSGPDMDSGHEYHLSDYLPATVSRPLRSQMVYVAFHDTGFSLGGARSIRDGRRVELASPEEGTRAKDVAAYELFMAKVEGNRG